MNDKVTNNEIKTQLQIISESLNGQSQTIIKAHIERAWAECFTSLFIGIVLLYFFHIFMSALKEFLHETKGEPKNLATGIVTIVAFVITLIILACAIYWLRNAFLIAVAPEYKAFELLKENIKQLR